MKPQDTHDCSSQLWNLRYTVILQLFHQLYHVWKKHYIALILHRNKSTKFNHNRECWMRLKTNSYTEEVFMTSCTNYNKGKLKVVVLSTYIIANCTQPPASDAEINQTRKSGGGIHTWLRLWREGNLQRLRQLGCHGHMLVTNNIATYEYLDLIIRL